MAPSPNAVPDPSALRRKSLEQQAQAAGVGPDMGMDVLSMIQQGQRLQSAKGADGKPLDYVYIFLELDRFFRVTVPAWNRYLVQLGELAASQANEVAALKERLAGSGGEHGGKK